MNVRNRIVNYELLDVDPYAIADFARRNDPLVHRSISRIIKESVIKEIYYCEGYLEDESLEYNKVCKVMLARVYPNDIQLADIEFTNLYEPLIESKSSSAGHIFSGLGLIKTLILNIEQYVISNELNYITLTADGLSEMKLFEIYGYNPEENDFTKS